MKRMFSFCLSILFVFISFSPAFCASNKKSIQNASTLLIKENGRPVLREKIPQNVEIKKQNGKWGVINKDNGEVLIPYNYDKIKKFGSDTVQVKKGSSWGILTNNNRLVMSMIFEKIYKIRLQKKMPDDILHTIYLGKNYSGNYYATTPGRTSNDLFEKAFNQNNAKSWVKFENYPKEGFIVLKKGGKYGYIASKGSDTWIIMPKYKNIYIPDKATTVYQQFGISYSDLNNIFVQDDYGDWQILAMNGKIKEYNAGKKLVTLDGTIDEDINIENGNIILTYKSMNFPHSDKYIIKKFNDTHLMDKKGKEYLRISTAPNKMRFKKFDINTSLNDIYKENNDIAFVKFYNYPSTGMHTTIDKDKKYKLGLIIFDKNGNKEIPNEYEGFKFQDSNTGIFKQLGISFSSPDRIIAKKNGRWGIIDSDNKVIVDFKYDKMIVLSAKPVSETTFNDKGVNIKYKNIEFPSDNIVLVQKGDLQGLIDRNGKYIIPLKKSIPKMKDMRKHIKTYNATISKDKRNELIVNGAIYTGIGIISPAIIAFGPIFFIWFFFAMATGQFC